MRIDSSSSQDDIKSLLEENIKLNKQILSNTEKTRRYIFWLSFSNWIKTLALVAPIVLAAIFLPPLIKQATKSIQEFQKTIPGAAVLPKDGVDILKQYESLLKGQ